MTSTNQEVSNCVQSVNITGTEDKVVEYKYFYPEDSWTKIMKRLTKRGYVFKKDEDEMRMLYAFERWKYCYYNWYISFGIDFAQDWLVENLPGFITNYKNTPNFEKHIKLFYGLLKPKKCYDCGKDADIPGDDKNHYCKKCWNG